MKDTAYAPTLDVGDHVLIYEFSSGPSLLLPNGEKLRRNPGRQGIICAARIVQPFERRSDKDAIERFDNGKTADFRYIARTTNTWEMVHLPRAHVNALLKYGENYSFHGFNSGRGIKELRKETFERVRSACKPA